jgi:hypothetical protein
MLIEGLRPLCLVFDKRMIRLIPGYPVYFSYEEAQRILEKAGRKVRVVNDVKDLVEHQIMWKSEKGTCGPASIISVDACSTGTWMLVQYRRDWLWIHESKVMRD